MYKTRLQELCHKKKWELPKYTSARTTTAAYKNPSLHPRYTAAVTVQDHVFETSEDFKTVKEAQNTAARIAFDHFNAPPQPPPSSVNSLFQTASTADSPPEKQPDFDLLQPSSVPSSITSPPVSVQGQVLKTPDELKTIKEAQNTPARINVGHMYKNRLQELCHKKKWELPKYTSTRTTTTYKNGPHNVPRYTATVSVQDHVFETLEDFKTTKEAQNAAARIAFDHFNVLPTVAATDSALPTVNSQLETASTSASLPVAASLPETQPLFGILQPAPIPSSITSPPPVSAQGQVFKTLEEFKTIKEAQNTPSRIAFDHSNVPPQVAVANGSAPPTACTGAPLPIAASPPVAAPPPEMQPVFDLLQPSPLTSSLPSPPGVYKNRLREFAKKKGLLCPSYETVSSGMSHKPIFVSTVTIGTDTFRGDEEKTKKQAEMNAAKVAYFALTQGNISQNILPTTANSSMVPTVDECTVAGNISPSIQSTTTIRKCQDTSNEGSDPPAKRAKSFPETFENQPWRLWKTVVIPRELDKEATA